MKASAVTPPQIESTSQAASATSAAALSISRRLLPDLAASTRCAPKNGMAPSVNARPFARQVLARLGHHHQGQRVHLHLPFKQELANLFNGQGLEPRQTP